MPGGVFTRVKIKPHSKCLIHSDLNYSDHTGSAAVIRPGTWPMESRPLSRLPHAPMDLQKAVYGSQSQSSSTAKMYRCTIVGSW